MGVEIGFCLVKTLGGVAVLAAEQARLVHADVPADNAPARLALGGILRPGTSMPNASAITRSSTHLPGRIPNGRRSISSAQLTISIPFSPASSAKSRINGPKSSASHGFTAAGVPSSFFSRASIFRYMSTMLTTTLRVCPLSDSASRWKFSRWNAGGVSPAEDDRIVAPDHPPRTQPFRKLTNVPTAVAAAENCGSIAADIPGS